MADVPRSKKSMRIKAQHTARRWYRHVLMIEDTPHRVGLGFALGMYIGWLPIVGIQMIVAAVICFCARANPLASLPPVWISNPLTMVPMYWIQSQVGALFIGKALSWAEITMLWHTIREKSIWDGTMHFFTAALDAFITMVVGGSIIGIICALPSYLLVVRGVTSYQRHLAHKRDSWKAASQTGCEDQTAEQ